MSARTLDYTVFAVLGPLLCVAAICSAQTADAGQRKSVDLRFARRQKGAALEILSAKSTDYFLAQVEVKNTSKRTITSITLGIMMRLPYGGVPGLINGGPIATHMRPGKRTLLRGFRDLKGGGVTSADSMKYTGLKPRLGILCVEFSEGPPYRFEPLEHGRFAARWR